MTGSRRIAVLHGWNAADCTRCIAVGGHAARGCDPSRPIGRGATRLQVSGTAPKSRAPLTGLRRIADVHQARQRGVESGGTWMTAVRVGELTLSTHCRHAPDQIGRPKLDVRTVEKRESGRRVPPNSGRVDRNAVDPSATFHNSISAPESRCRDGRCHHGYKCLSRVRNHCSMSFPASAIPASSSPKRSAICVSHPTTDDTRHLAANHWPNCQLGMVSLCRTPASTSAASYPAIAAANFLTEGCGPTHMPGRAAS